MRNTHTNTLYLFTRWAQILSATRHATYDASKIIFMLFMLSQDVIPQPLIP